MNTANRYHSFNSLQSYSEGDNFIALRNLSKHYTQKNGLVKAVDDLTLQIRMGEFVSLLGPSGCGKSTTLMMIAGLIKPTSGDILFNGKNVTHLPPRERNIGMVFQSYALYPNMNAIENICFPLKNQGVKKNKRLILADEVAEKLKIEDLLDRKVYQLSGGQQQRVAIARALVKKPDILLLDEPMSNLDARLKIDMRDEIRHLQKEIGITTIIVTHDQEEALAVADRVAILDQGILQSYTEPEDQYNKPSNLFIARFLGNPPMNFLSCTIKREGDWLNLVHSGSIVKRININVHLLPYIDTPGITLGFRPHSLRITSDESTLKGRIVLVEQLGREKLIKIELENQSGTSLRLLQKDSDRIVFDQLINLTLDDEYHLFDDTKNTIYSQSSDEVYNTSKELVNA